MGFFTGVFGQQSEEQRIANRIAYLERLVKRGNYGALVPLGLYRADPNGREGRNALFDDYYLTRSS